MTPSELRLRQALFAAAFERVIATRTTSRGDAIDLALEDVEHTIRAFRAYQSEDAQRGVGLLE